MSLDDNAEILLVTATEAMARILDAVASVIDVTIEELPEMERPCKQAAAVAWGKRLSS